MSELKDVPKTKILPFGNRLAVVDPPAEDQSKTESGLYLPPSAVQEPVVKGVVVAVGEGYDPTSYPGWEIKSGDVVWYRISSAREVADTKVIDIDDVIAIERDEEGEG